MFRKIILLLIIQVGVLYANDTAIEGAGGSLTIKESETNISIQNEILNVDMFDDHYQISVQYDFKNNGVEKKLMTGFPEYKFGTQEYKPIKNFHMQYISGEKIPSSYIKVNEQINPAMEITGWYVKEVIFKAKSITTVKLEYESDYGIAGFYQLVSYLLGTGKTWAKDISNLHIRINNHANFWINNVGIRDDIPYEYKYIADNIYEIHIRTYEPKIDDELSITFSDFPKFEDPMDNIDYGYFLFKERTINKKWLRFLSLSQLRLLRNTIYAYRGYSFKSDFLRQYFNNTDWYKPNKNFSESLFTENEKKNIKIIMDFEKELRQ